jgi:hypothetical protein
LFLAAAWLLSLLCLHNPFRPDTYPRKLIPVKMRINGILGKERNNKEERNKKE